MSSKVEFLYLDEEQMVQAGVTNMHECIDVCAESLRLLGLGDYQMGGRNHNSHGVKIAFPDNPAFPGMPKNGPDRRFMAMVAYLGGKFHVAGEKWYGSNRANVEKGLPRSILMIVLNDVETGAPISFMSGNLVSAMRTGAIPGVGAKYLARKDAKVCGLLGAGVISRTSFMALVDACENLDTVQIYDIFPASAEKLAAYIKEHYPQIKNIKIAASVEDAVRGADVINSATSGKDFPYINSEWIKPGAYISVPAGVRFDKDFLLNNARCIVDNWKMYESFEEELEPPYFENLGLVAGYYLDWLKDGSMKRDKIEDIGEILAGKIPGRKNDDEIFVFCQGGQPIYDVAWAKTIYDNAKEMGLGTMLKVWDTPHMY